MDGFNLERLVRANIRSLKPYSSARDEFSGQASVWLDANENPHGSALSAENDGLNRYPDPHQSELKQAIAPIKGVKPSQIFLGHGSDEAIDLLFRIFCNPGKDKALIMPPTYGMYKVSAAINDIEIVEAPLTEDFQIDHFEVDGLMEDYNIKLAFVCSPNNPTGNAIETSAIEKLLVSFHGIVVVDEAYIDFCPENSLVNKLDEYPNLVVLQTFSKAWGMAGLRVGMAIASEAIIDLMTAVKPPYNLSQVTQKMVLEALQNQPLVAERTAEILSERRRLYAELLELDMVDEIIPSDANFLLVRIPDHYRAVFDNLISKGIVVRDRNKELYCEGCLRFTVGTAAENDALMDALRTFENQLNDA